MPIDTAGSPRSTRVSVWRVMNARSAITAIVIRRRLRADDRSSPSFASALRTVGGRPVSAEEPRMDDNLDQKPYYVNDIIHCAEPVPSATIMSMRAASLLVLAGCNSILGIAIDSDLTRGARA